MLWHVRFFGGRARSLQRRIEQRICAAKTKKAFPRRVVRMHYINTVASTSCRSCPFLSHETSTNQLHRHLLQRTSIVSADLHKLKNAIDASSPKHKESVTSLIAVSKPLFHFLPGGPLRWSETTTLTQAPHVARTVPRCWWKEPTSVMMACASSQPTR